MNRRIFLVSGTIALLFAVHLIGNAGGQTPRVRSEPSLSLGIVSQKPQEAVEERFQDFVNYLAQRLSRTSESKGRIVVAPTAVQLTKLLEEKKVDFYMESPYPTYLVNRLGVARVLLRRWKGGVAEYKSIIFTRTDSGITRLEDLLGKIIVFEDPGSTSAYLLPKVLLINKGFMVAEKSSFEATVSPKEIGYLFAGSERNIVTWVLSKKAAAGAFSNDDLAKLDEKRKAEFFILAETKMFPRHLLSVRKDLDPVLVKRLQDILLSMHQDEQGRRILQKTDNTTQFDLLPGGEEGVRRQLMEVFRPRVAK